MNAAELRCAIRFGMLLESNLSASLCSSLQILDDDEHVFSRESVFD